jgi:hypothetical protein
MAEGFQGLGIQCLWPTQSPQARNLSWNPKREGSKKGSRMFEKHLLSLAYEECQSEYSEGKTHSLSAASRGSPVTIPQTSQLLRPRLKAKKKSHPTQPLLSPHPTLKTGMSLPGRRCQKEPRMFHQPLSPYDLGAPDCQSVVKISCA